MDATFERGDGQKPRGHAVLYFRSTAEHDEVWGTYIVILPITVDVSKYVPPFLMNQLGDAGPKDLSAFAFPPTPEKLESYEYLNSLADARNDDVLFGGSFNPIDAAAAMMLVSEAVQWYAGLYSESTEGVEAEEPTSAGGGFGVNEVLYGLMNDGDKLSELTRLVGRLRFAVDGNEDSLAAEAEGDINLIAEHLPDNNRITHLIEAIKTGGQRGETLANLYLQRCFHMVREEYGQLGEVDDKLEALEAEVRAEGREESL